MINLIISPVANGRSITKMVTDENVQAVCDHVNGTDDLLLVENPFGSEIEATIKLNGLKTGSLQNKSGSYRVIYKED